MNIIALKIWLQVLVSISEYEKAVEKALWCLKPRFLIYFHLLHEKFQVIFQIISSQSKKKKRLSSILYFFWLDFPRISASHSQQNERGRAADCLCWAHTCMCTCLTSQSVSRRLRGLKCVYVLTARLCRQLRVTLLLLFSCHVWLNSTLLHSVVAPVTALTSRSVTNPIDVLSQSPPSSSAPCL